ncbi:aminotransferase-like domain-containing protein [Nonomuraea gerenzanensis]|uniref:Transcriptional regulator, GntR family domain / Aspartate aminotransferase n=1 Tax=Nonomuraea gerenzanensis TaxID=93944 RepID=A0A1M4EI67_9ACTN|nr:PLP-dependent aminotransferase family protein [Nonomuraea gerenzanensis]UBU09926.1 PLP-dependent aminotransferase family protein [Nonomuraea gerenzanensis]SBO98378.1 Transcriptional regulator, GntR family domain / Aspartate aminotransferase [Nonomuraea gerenzanensis]
MGREDTLVTLVRDRLRLHQGPPSRRLAGALTDLAQTGLISPGTRLPSERDLAQAVGVSRGTVAAAFNALCEEGLCERRHGSGTYVLGTPSFGGLLQAGAVRADLSTSVVPDPSHLTLPPLDPADLLRAPSGHGYDAMGDPRLRTVLAGAEGADPRHVLVTAGAQQGIDLAARVLLRPGDRVLVGDPAYGGALSVFRRAGAHVVAADLTSPAAVEGALARHRPAVVYVAGVDNPTGAVPPLRHVAELAADAGVTVVEDRALAALVYDGVPPPEPLAAAHPYGTVTVGSLSKVLWGGLRVGWLTAPEPLLARLTEAKVDADLATSAVAQRLATDLLERNPVAPWLAELARRREHCLTALPAHLPEWTWTRPAGGLSVWVRLPGTDTDRFAAVAREHGVAVAPGSLFSPDGRHRDRLRLSFALPPDLLDRAFADLALAWRAYGR